MAAAPDRGVQIRAGVHSGECERRADDLAGLAVHIAARVCAAAAPGEVLVSRTARDLVMGSGLRFLARGEHSLKGVPGTWELFALTGAEEAPSRPTSAPSPTAVDRAAGRRHTPGAGRGARRQPLGWRHRATAPLEALQVIVDAWAQHPTERFLRSDFLASLKRWSPEAIPTGEPPVEATVAAMDAAGVDKAILSRLARPAGRADLQRRGRGDRRRAPGPLRRPRRRRPRQADGGGARAAPARDRAGLQGPARAAVAVGDAADRPALLPAVRRVRRARRPVLHPGRPHRAAASRPRSGGRSPTSTRSRSTSPSS